MNSLAFVDIETTGSNFDRDRITEIAIVTLATDEKNKEKEEKKETVSRFETLLDPETYIPPGITTLTGITPQMVQGKPTFEEIAKDLHRELENKIFIAHNARFDYGFLRAAFKRVDIDFKPKVVCTVKLSRLLFPEQKRHNLDTIIESHGLKCEARHRAMGDADILLQFWRVCVQRFGIARLLECIAQLLKQSTLPAHIDHSLITSIPDTPGVYIFYADNQEYLYIGKSKTLRTRVLSHFQNALTQRKEAKMSLRVKHIEWIETSGELGALLLESKLIKEHLPTMNVRLRRNTDMCAWGLEPDKRGYLVASLKSKHEFTPGSQEHVYGPFVSKRAATELLKNLAQANYLCTAVLGLEKTSPGKPCFGYQLKMCGGACVGLEDPSVHNLKLTSALEKWELSIWPYPGAIAVREGDISHVFNKWSYLGTAKNYEDLQELIECSAPEFDLDIYKIIKQHLKKVSRGRISVLSNPGVDPE